MVADAAAQGVVALEFATIPERSAAFPGGATAAEPGIAVSIGTENDHRGLQTASVVSTTYGQDGIGSLGVLGPTRMDYSGTMGAVRAVAAYLSEVLEHR